MDALSNLNSIRADVIEVWDAGSLSYKTIQETIVGLPPATLNSIELLASAIGNDPGFFEAVSTGLAAKADTSSVESELASRDTAIAAKASSVELTSELTTRDTTIATKASTVELESQLATVNTALDSKASSTDVVEELALIDTAIASKASSVTLASELASRDTAIASKASSVTLASELATRDTAIALKASSVTLASELATRDTAIAAKASSVTLASELASRDTAIAGKASASVVSALDTRVTDVERVVTVESGVTYNYLEAGTDALVIRGPNEIAANFLGSSAGSLEGRALFYKDVLIGGELLMPNSDITTRALTVGGSSLTSLLAAQENSFTAVLPLMKGFNASGDAELKVDYLNTTLETDWIRARTATGVTIDDDLFVDGHLAYTTIDSPYWVAANCSANGTISHQKGAHDIGIVKRSGDTAFNVSFPAHPEGDKYLVLTSSSEFHIIYRSQTSTSLIIYLRGSTNAGATQGDGSFNIAILK